ncbi:DNA-packaging protein [Salmonella enterica subsp. enterica serovar Weltevreden]|nr:DNA-packaging protein [Salmonella enterica subsp. enterica serovar Weltevreden]
MNVNKKKLAEIFGCDVRTVTAWQSQGLPLVSGGGKGNEAVFDTAAAISWYASLAKPGAATCFRRRKR